MPNLGIYSLGSVVDSSFRSMVHGIAQGLHAAQAAMTRNYIGGAAHLVRCKGMLLPGVRTLMNSRELTTAILEPEKYTIAHIVDHTVYAEVADQLSDMLRSAHPSLDSNTVHEHLHEEEPREGSLLKLGTKSHLLDVYAKRVLNIPLSSASVERVFSILTRLLDDIRRSRLGPETLLAELLLHANSTTAMEMVQELAMDSAKASGVRVDNLVVVRADAGAIP